MGRWIVSNIDYDYYAIADEIKNTSDTNEKQELINKVKEHNDSYYLLANGIVTKDNKELYDDIINYIINGNEKFHAGYLLIDKIVSREDKDLFDKIVEVAIQYPEHRKMLIESDIITEDEATEIELKNLY